jgi:hypothetical protein
MSCNLTRTVSTELGRAFLRALLLQAGLLVLSALVLDFGETLRGVCVSSLAFWAGTIIVLLRRPSNPTRGDLFYLRWGLLILVPVGVPASLTLWLMKGAI